MAIYPRARKLRRQLVCRDLIVLAFLGIAGWFAHVIYLVVQSLSSVSSALTDAGAGIQQLLNGLAAAISAIPFIGTNLAESIRAASSATGGNLVNRGQSLGNSIHQTALIFGVTAFLIPALAILIIWAPNRIRQIRELRAATIALSQTSDNIEQVLAMRAITHLSFSALLVYSQDPLGDYARGEFSSLAQAARDFAGA